VWIPEIKMAIEYNGLQHYEPVEFFGGQKGFEDTVNRDNRKRKKCKEHNVYLLEVRKGYKWDDVKIAISQRVSSR